MNFVQEIGNRAINEFCKEFDKIIDEFEPNDYEHDTFTELFALFEEMIGDNRDKNYTDSNWKESNLYLFIKLFKEYYDKKDFLLINNVKAYESFCEIFHYIGYNINYNPFYFVFNYILKDNEKEIFLKKSIKKLNIGYKYLNNYLNNEAFLQMCWYFGLDEEDRKDGKFKEIMEFNKRNFLDSDIYPVIEYIERTGFDMVPNFSSFIDEIKEDGICEAFYSASIFGGILKPNGELDLEMVKYIERTLKKQFGKMGLHCYINISKRAKENYCEFVICLTYKILDDLFECFNDDYYANYKNRYDTIPEEYTKGILLREINLEGDPINKLLRYYEDVMASLKRAGR